MGVVAFDGLSIGVAHVSAADDADSAARAASHEWEQSHDRAAALEAAQASAAEHGETVIATSLQIAPDGTVQLDIEHNATTLVVQHIHALRSWVTITEGGSGKYVEP